MNSQNSIDLVATQSGTYNCLITGTSCSGMSANSIQVTVNPNPQIFIQAPCGGSGQIILTALPATSGATYCWNKNNGTLGPFTTQTCTVSSAGTYRVIVTQPTTGCSSSASKAVTTSTGHNMLTATAIVPPSLNISPSTPYCNNNLPSNTTVSITNSSIYSSIVWNSGDRDFDTTFSTPSSTQHAYAFLTNSVGCTYLADIPITVNTPPTIAISGLTNVCSNGTIQLTASGAGTNGTYSWPTTGLTCSPCNSNVVTANPTQTYTYTVTGTDNNGCSNTSTHTITLIQSDPTLSATASLTQNAICTNGNYNNGAVSLSASGGNSPYQYSWSPSGGSNSSASNLQPGNYNCVVTDIKNCSVTSNTITVGSSVSFSVTTSSTNTTCNGPNGDGTATVTPNPNNGGYSYLWTGNNITSQTTATATNLPSGTYTVQVTKNSCSISSTATVGYSVTASYSSPITTSVTWSSTTPITIGGNVIIESGGTLTISNTHVKFVYTPTFQNGENFYAARITVKPGGKLIVNGGILEGCNSTSVWDGIKLLGIRSVNQLQTGTYKQPEAFLNGCTIKNAYIALSARNYDYFYPHPNYAVAYDGSSSGGIFYLDDVTFENNKTAIDYPDYQYPLVSTIDNCHFNYTSSSLFKTQYTTSKPMIFIKVMGSIGLRIANSDFNSTITGVSTDLLGTGVLIVRGGIRFRNLTSISAGNNYFNNLTTGIQISQPAWGPANLFLGNYFINNYQGVYIQNGRGDYIKDNHFVVPEPSGAIIRTYGLYALSSNNLHIEKNEFKVDQFSSENSTYGCAFKSSNGVVFANDFKQNSGPKAMDISIQTELNCPLLSFKCNNFEEPLNYSIAVISGSIKTQGNGCNTGPMDFRAGNHWDYSCSGYQQIYNLSSTPVTYFAHHRDMASNPTTVPTCSLNVNKTDCGMNENSGDCANAIPNLPPPPSTDYSDYINAINSQIEDYENLISEDESNEAVLRGEINSLEYEKIFQASLLDEESDLNDFLSNSNQVDLKLDLIEKYLTKKNETEFEDHLNSLEEGENFSADDKSTYETYASMLYGAIDETGYLSTEALSSSELDEIIEANTIASSKAEILLQYLSDEFTRHDIPELPSLRHTLALGKSNLSKINIYPNPTSNTVYIDYEVESTDEESNLKVVVKDMFGRTIKVISLEDTAGLKQIELSEATSGMYNIIIKNNNDILYINKIALMH